MCYLKECIQNLRSIISMELKFDTVVAISAPLHFPTILPRDSQVMCHQRRWKGYISIPIPTSLWSQVRLADGKTWGVSSDWLIWNRGQYLKSLNGNGQQGKDEGMTSFPFISVQRLEVDGTAFCWLASFLRDWFQWVMIEGTTGLLLSPLLFNFYMRLLETDFFITGLRIWKILEDIAFPLMAYKCSLKKII